MQRKHNKNLTENARYLRRNMTKEEKRLWYDFLKDYPIRFLRQKVIDTYIADFYCHKARLIIELDGSQHYEENAVIKDKIRTQRIEKRDLTVIRIPNTEVNKNFDGVCWYIDMIVKNSHNKPPLPKGAMVAGGNRLSPTEEDSGDRDRFSGGGIYSGRQKLKNN